MRKIINIFPVTVLDSTIDNFENINQSLKEKLSVWFDNIQDKRLLSHTWKDFKFSNKKLEIGYSSFNANDLSKEQDFAFFFENISTIITDFFAQLGYLDKWRFENAWSNAYPPGSFVPLHDHRGMHWSGVYYVNALENCGDLVLTDPKEYALSNEPENTRYRGNFEFRIEPLPGKLVLFPGYLKHETMPNQSLENRIIISFNINCHE